RCRLIEIESSAERPRPSMSFPLTESSPVKSISGARNISTSLETLPSTRLPDLSAPQDMLPVTVAPTWSSLIVIESTRGGGHCGHDQMPPQVPVTSTVGTLGELEAAQPELSSTKLTRNQPAGLIGALCRSTV